MARPKEFPKKCCNGIFVFLSVAHVQHKLQEKRT
jgi:hypothetical protein